MQKWSQDRVRFNTWLYAIGGDILGLGNAHIFKYRRVCHLHFEEKYHCRNNRISNVAVPTLLLAGLNQISQPKLPFAGRKPLQGVVNQPIPSTSTAPESQQQLMYTSTNIEENTVHKENIDPETVVCEQVPPSTIQGTVPNLDLDMICQPIPQFTSQVEMSVQKNLGRKVSAGMMRLSKAERALQLKLMSAKRKLNKMKKKKL